METKKCALMRQTWYEAAKKRMKEMERLAFYEACFEYEFYGILPDSEPELFPFDSALLMFDVVRDDLQRDAEKAETIAMRNRRNGMLGGRPRKQQEVSESTNPQETQNNPENPRGNFGVYTTLHYTTLQKDPDKSVSLARRKKRHTDRERYDFFRILFVFFYSGAIDPAGEAAKFMDYYSARDWQVGRGQKIKDRVALARTWDIKDAEPGLISSRKMYADLIEAIDPEEPELLTHFVAMVKDDEAKQVTIRCNSGHILPNILESKYLAPMSVYFRDILKLDGYTLMYQQVD